MTCSARSFSSLSSDSMRASSATADAPRGRVPAIGRVETMPPRIDSSLSGDELITEKPR